MATIMDRNAARRRMIQQTPDDPRLTQAKHHAEILRHQLLQTFDKEDLRQMMFEQVIFTIGKADALIWEIWNLKAEQMLDTDRRIYRLSASCKKRESRYQPLPTPKETP